MTNIASLPKTSVNISELDQIKQLLHSQKRILYCFVSTNGPSYG